MPERTYPITYELRVEDPPLAASAIPKDRGGCDAVILVSIMHSPTGSSSCMIASRDGRTKRQISRAELFKAWAMLADTLASEPGLDDERKAICSDAFEKIRRIVLRDRGGPALA